MTKQTVKGYPLDSEGAESEEEMLSYEKVIDLLWKQGILGCRSTRVCLNGDKTECVWVYSTALLLEKIQAQIKEVLHGLSVKISTFPNREEIEIKIV